MNGMKARLLGLSATLLLSLPLFASAEVTDRIVAIVNDDIITLREVERYVVVESKSRYPSMNEYVRNMQLRDKMDAFIDGILINQQAKKLKIDVADKEIEETIDNIKKQNLISEKELREQLKRENISYNEFVQGVRRSLVRSRVLARAVSQEMQIDDKKLKDYYDSHGNELAEQEYKLQHIFISSQRRDAAEKAKEAFSQLQKDVPFEDVARDYSDEPSRGEGGDIGFVKSAELIPELRQGLAILVPGTYSNIIQTGYGFHIIKLSEVKRGELAPFEQVQDKIRQKLIQDESAKRYKEFIAKLKSSSYIEVKI